MADAAVIVNLFQYVNTDKQFQFTVYKSDGVTPQDVTGFTISLVVHAYGDPNVAYFTKSAALTTPTKGVVTVTVSAADNASMPPNLYDYRLERTDAANDIVLARGTYSLLGK